MQDAVELASTAIGRPVRVAPTSSGGDHRSWWVERTHVLRCASNAEGSDRLHREVQLRQFLRDRTAVLAPRSAGSGTWRGLAWTLDERLAGEPVDEAAPGPAGAVDSDLVGVMAALRGAAEEEGIVRGLPSLALPDLPTLVGNAERACRALGLDSAASWLVGPGARASTEGPRIDRQVLVHGDLKGEHLLVAGGRLSGVLDWADAGRGPASLDVEGLAVSLGGPRAMTVASAAGTPDAEIDRGLLLARCRTSLRLSALVRGEPSGPEPLLRRQWTLAWMAT
nr:aminoglycoside phosphotransferase family protein [Quadrisphaera sp. RL12-1S]